MNELIEVNEIFLFIKKKNKNVANVCKANEICLDLFAFCSYWIYFCFVSKKKFFCVEDRKESRRKCDNNEFFWSGDVHLLCNLNQYLFTSSFVKKIMWSTKYLMEHRLVIIYQCRCHLFPLERSKNIQGLKTLKFRPTMTL